MTSKAAFLCITLAFAPVLVGAQSAPPPPPAPSSPGPMQWSPDQMRAHMQAMRQFRERMEREMQSARTRILSILTASQRALVARVVGNLAVSSNPDPRAAAAQLDAALSQRQRQAILDAQRSVMEQMRSMMDSMRSQMNHDMMRMHEQMMHPPMRRGRHAPDAGRILLHVASIGDDRMPMMRP